MPSGNITDSVEQGWASLGRKRQLPRLSRQPAKKIQNVQRLSQLPPSNSFRRVFIHSRNDEVRICPSNHLGVDRIIEEFDALRFPHRACFLSIRPLVCIVS